MATLVERDVPLAPLTTLKVGGKAAHFAVVRDMDSLREALAYATEQKLPVVTLGGGSNVLIADRGLSGLVIKNEITGIDVKVVEETVRVRIGAGEELDAVIKQLTEVGYWGLENLSGIPGTVGGAVVQNANAYGVTIGDLVSAVETVCLSDGTQQHFARDECTFEYRNSRFKTPNGRGQYLITHVVLELSTTPVTALAYQSASQSMAKRLAQRGITTPTPEDIRTVVREIRQTIGMLPGMYNSAGSFFKNPIVDQSVFNNVFKKVTSNFSEEDKAFSPWHWNVDDKHEKISAAFLLECTPYNKTAYKDKTYHDAVSISPVHSLSIVNVNSAKATDIMAFVDEITATVNEQFGVTLESEVCFLADT